MPFLKLGAADRERLGAPEAIPISLNSVTNREAIRYLNRLSDLLFILARVANPDGDVKWRPGGDR